MRQEQQWQTHSKALKTRKWTHQYKGLHQVKSSSASSETKRHINLLKIMLVLKP